VTATRPRNTGQRSGSARGRILEAASRRFYDDGIAATGIDAITAEAGVAKMSLYNNFASKAALVEAYLVARHEEWLGLYRARCAEATTARERVLAVFDAYLDHASSAYEHGFRGCGLLNAAAELPAGDPGRAAVRQHKEQVEAIVRGHLEEITDADHAGRLAEHLSFLLEGAVARAGLEGTPARLVDARALADDLLGAL
jgi:AcrR family transcriptional regulator